MNKYEEITQDVMEIFNSQTKKFYNIYKNNCSKASMELKDIRQEMSIRIFKAEDRLYSKLINQGKDEFIKYFAVWFRYALISLFQKIFIKSEKVGEIVPLTDEVIISASNSVNSNYDLKLIDEIKRLKDLDNLTFRKIGQVLNIPFSTVYKYYQLKNF